MFPLRKRQLIRGCAAHIKAGLGCAADHEADQDELLLPFTGTVETYWGKEGGNWLRLIRDDNGHKLEFAHLDKYLIKPGHYQEGTRAAITGNTGEVTTGPHLHTQIIDTDGKRLDPESYQWDIAPMPIQYPITLKVQVIFNNQKWSNELSQLLALRDNVFIRSNGKLTLDFLPVIYSSYTDIPFGDFYHPLGSGETGKMIVRDWYVDNPYSLSSEEADVVMFVCTRTDWKGQSSNGSYTYGHCQWNYPSSFPIMLEMMVQQGDKSWKYPNLDAFIHYGTHELAHGLEQNSHEQQQDKTHEYDYRDQNGITQLFTELDYNKLYYQLTHKVGFRRRMAIFKKEGFPDLYFLVGDVMVPFAATYETFLKDFKNAIITELKADEFIKYRTANYNVVKAR